MSMPKNQAKELIVYVRRRKKKETVAANVAACSAQQDISRKEIGEMSSKTLNLEPNKLMENKEAKTVEKGRTTKDGSNSSILDTRQSKDGSARNDKIISDNREENCKMLRHLDEQKMESLLVLPTHEEINGNQLALVHDRNIDYVGSQLDFSKDLGETAQRLAHTKVWERNTFDADQKGKMIRQENNSIMNSADFCAQRGNKGITIGEKSLDSRSEEMAKFLKLQYMNQVTPNYLLSNGMKKMSTRPNHKPRITVHPTKIIGPSRFSPNYDQNMQRTSVSVPHNFSLMKLLMENENSSTLTDEELLYAKDLLSTDQGLSLEGKGVQQSHCSQVENHQNMQRTSESATTNLSYMKLLMEDEENSKLTNELCAKQFLNTQYSLSSEGQMVQQWPYGQVENYQNMQRTPESATSNFSYMKLLMADDESSTLSCDLYEKQLLGTQHSLSLEGHAVQQLPVSQVQNYQNMQRTPESATSNFSYMKLLMEDDESSTLSCDLYEKQLLGTQYSLSLEGHTVQQLPVSQVENYQNMLRTPESATSNFSYMKLLMEDDESSVLTSDLYEKQLLGTQYSLSLEGQTVQQFPVSQLENYQFGNSSAGQMVQQQPCSQVGNSSFDNSVQQNCQNQVLPQSQEISFRELLAGDNISYMDLLTREDLLISWNCDA